MVQKLKVSFTLQPATEAQRGSTGSYTFSLTSALDGGGWLTPCSGRFTLKNDPTSIVKEAEWAPGSVWAGAENLAPPPTGFDSRTVQPIASRYTD